MPNEFKETEGTVVQNQTEDLTADIHEHDASPFLGVCKITLFWNRDTLVLVPSIVVSGAIKKLTNVTVNLHSHFTPKGLARFWWNTIEPWSFAQLKLVDGLVHFTKYDWAISFHQLFLLGD